MSNRKAAFLRELEEVLEKMESKELIYGRLFAGDGRCCALGAVMKKRGIQQKTWTSVTGVPVPAVLEIPVALAEEITQVNDLSVEEGKHMRWRRMRQWVRDELERLGAT